MAKYELKFIDCIDEHDYIKVDSELDNDAQHIRIVGSYVGDEFTICLDKSTAIKFAKTLRTEINKIQE